MLAELFSQNGSQFWIRTDDNARRNSFNTWSQLLQFYRLLNDSLKSVVVSMKWGLDFRDGRPGRIYVGYGDSRRSQSNHPDTGYQ